MYACGLAANGLSIAGVIQFVLNKEIQFSGNYSIYIYVYFIPVRSYSWYLKLMQNIEWVIEPVNDTTQVAATTYLLSFYQQHGKNL